MSPLKLILPSFLPPPLNMLEYLSIHYYPLIIQHARNLEYLQSEMAEIRVYIQAWSDHIQAMTQQLLETEDQEVFDDGHMFNHEATLLSEAAIHNLLDEETTVRTMKEHQDDFRALHQQDCYQFQLLKETLEVC